MIYFTIASGIYIVSFWLPSIIKQTGIADPLRIGLLTAALYAAAVVVMVVLNSNADRMRERRWHTLVPCLVTGTGLILTATASHNTALALTGMTMAAVGASSAQAAFWTLPGTFLTGAAAAAGIALVNSVGNIAGFASTFVVGWAASVTHNTAAGLYVFGGLLLLGGVAILTIPGRLVNK